MSHICIIEDDTAIAEIERDYLEINGFTVSIATDGVSGLNLAQTESFDLILLDLMLPQLDGFTLCRKLRERLDIPILMVTAKKEDIDKIRGLGLGADDYMTKPFSPSELVARVKAHLARYDRLTGSAVAQRTASPTLLLPEPFGPTIPVIPLLNLKIILFAKDLNPYISMLFKYIRYLTFFQLADVAAPMSQTLHTALLFSLNAPPSAPSPCRLTRRAR